MKTAFLRSQDNANGFMCALLQCKCTWKFSLMRCGLKLFGMTTTPRWMLKRKATCAAVLLYFLPMAFSTGSFSKGGEDTFTLEKNWEKKKKNLPIFNVKTYRTYSFMDRILQLFGKQCEGQQRSFDTQEASLAVLYPMGCPNIDLVSTCSAFPTTDICFLAEETSHTDHLALLDDSMQQECCKFTFTTAIFRHSSSKLL